MEGSGELRLLFSPVRPLLVMRLLVLMGALGERGLNNGGAMDLWRACVFLPLEVSTHGCPACLQGPISGQQGRD